MACIIEGVPGQQWSAPEWMARNAAFFLIPFIESGPSGAEIAARLQTIIYKRAPHVPLGDLLSRTEVGHAWIKAVLCAEEAIAAEDPLSWNDPSSYEPFRKRFMGLRQLPMLPSPFIESLSQ